MIMKPVFRVHAFRNGWRFNKSETGEILGTILYNGFKTSLCIIFLKSNPQLK